MKGTKALALEEHARQQGFPFVCFDARGHGSSSGTFEGTGVADWYEDAATVLQHITPPGRHLLVGSSLGGWLALQLALDHPGRVAGLLLIAPALDITQQFWDGLSPQQQAAAEAEGRVVLPSSYMEPVVAGLQLFEQGRRFLMLRRLRELRVACPVHIIHSVQDDAVPVAISRQLFEELPRDDMVLTLLKDGDHRLSRPKDLALMLASLDLLRAVAAEQKQK